jgi:hypothetical protein
MAETLTDQFTYVDNGKLILKKSWWDPETGETYDTFDEQGDAPAGMATGAVADPGTLNPMTGLPTGGPGAASAAPDAGGSYGPTFNPASGKTEGSTAPQSGSYAAPNVTPAANSPAAGTGPGTNPFGTSPAANAPDMTDWARQDTLYNQANPGFALQNALIASGRNPFISGSPMMAALQRMAPGLQQAFLLNQAGQNLTPGDVTGTGDRYQQFLMNAIQGGNIPGILSGAARSLPNAINSIRDYQQQLLSNPMVNANPYLVELMRTLEAGSGTGTTNFLGSVLGPFMGRNMLTAYQGNLAASQAAAVRNQVNAPSFNTGDEQDIWRYLLGV